MQNSVSFKNLSPSLTRRQLFSPSLFFFFPARFLSIFLFPSQLRVVFQDMKDLRPGPAHRSRRFIQPFLSFFPCISCRFAQPAPGYVWRLTLLPRPYLLATRLHPTSTFSFLFHFPLLPPPRSNKCPLPPTIPPQIFPMVHRAFSALPPTTSLSPTSSGTRCRFISILNHICPFVRSAATPTTSGRTPFCWHKPFLRSLLFFRYPPAQFLPCTTKSEFAPPSP